MVERRLAMAKVAGSSPVFRSRRAGVGKESAPAFLFQRREPAAALETRDSLWLQGEAESGTIKLAGRSSQGAKAGVCKTPIRRFESALRLQITGT